MTDAVITSNDENKNIPLVTSNTSTDIHLDSNGDVHLNDGGFTRAKILYDKVKDKMPDR